MRRTSLAHFLLVPLLFEQSVVAQEPGPAPAATAATQQAAEPRARVTTVVLDPAHGGADAGARGKSGVMESEIVLVFARLIRTELERQGLRVALTRQGNDNPSFDERSAVANGLRNVLFISLHASSTGPSGTARAYSLPPPSHSSGQDTSAGDRALLSWDRAQEPFVHHSRRLAELVQIQLAQRFRGSPELPSTGSVRVLRTVAAPAIAIEVSSVSVPDRAALEQMAPALGEAVARGVAVYRSLPEPEAK